jgi:glycosyltransferase involved in cell wall biosynthesis
VSIKISLITVCLDSDKTIQDTLNSVQKQDYNNLEYIIVDGGSKDKTLDLVAFYRSVVTFLISENDNGIYDAMNKGISLATGDVIGFINSDDFYSSSHALTDIAAIFEDRSVDCCYADLCYVSSIDPSKIIRYWVSSNFSRNLFSKGWCPPHPTFFVRKSVYDKYGNFNLKYKIAADVELMARFLEVNHIKSRYLPKTLVHMRLGGKTNNNLNNIINQNLEILRALKSLKIKYSTYEFFMYKLISRLMQFIRKSK